MSELNFNQAKCYDSNVTPAQYNKLVDLCQAITLSQGVGYLLARSPVGTTLRIKPGTNGTNDVPPFTVSLAPISGDASNLSVRVRPGTVNQLVPDNLFDSHTVATSGTFYAKVTASTDGQNVTSCSLSADGTAPTNQTATANALPSSVEVLLALIKNGKAYQTQDGSLSLVGYQSFVVDKSPPAPPGQLTYTPYFVWNVSKI